MSKSKPKSKTESDAYLNMKMFWEKVGGKEFIKKYQGYAKKNVLTNYIVRSRPRNPHKDLDGHERDELEAELRQCKILILTANEVESRTLKRILYEESRFRKIYNYWKFMKSKQEEEGADDKGIVSDGEVVTSDDTLLKVDIARSVQDAKLFEINLEREAQYYFVTLGATDDEIEKDPSKKSEQIKIAYIAPPGTSSFSRNGSHKAVVHALRRFEGFGVDEYPSLIVSLGVAFGMYPAITKDCPPQRQNLGDVLIAKSIIAYDSKYKAENGELKFSNCESFFLEDGVRRAFGEMIEQSGSMPFSLPDIGKPLEHTPDSDFDMAHIRCHFGPIFSGGAVVNDPGFKNKLQEYTLAEGERKISSDVIGGEMEGAGIWFASLMVNNALSCIVIKGICDWGEDKNGWASFLEENDQDFFDKSLREKLPEKIYEVYKDNAQQAQYVIQEIDSIIQKYKNGQYRNLPKGYQTAYNLAKNAVNDMVKDSIQAYATEQAFKVLCYMLYTDPQLQKMPAQDPPIRPETRQREKRPKGLTDELTHSEPAPENENNERYNHDYNII